jgi:hypothetical protein
MFTCFAAVVPPASVPKALEYRFRVAHDEMNITTQRLP